MIVTKNLSEVIKERAINVSAMCFNTGLPAKAIYASLGKIALVNYELMNCLSFVNIWISIRWIFSSVMIGRRINQQDAAVHK